MRYVSTRGGIEPIGFNEAVMMGLARDGGLLLPETLPSVDSTKLNSWLNLPYQYLAVEILDLFTGELPRQDLEVLVDRSYASFSHPQVTPVR
jgi:threonine synthase